MDLRPKFKQWGLPPRSQGSRPTCSVFTFVGALEFALAQHRNVGERLSVEFLNWAASQARKRVADGGFFSDMWSGYTAHGVCTEREMPYQSEFDATRTPAPNAVTAARENLACKLELHWIKPWDVKTGLSSEEFATVKQTLQSGWPVCGGFRWPMQEIWKHGVLQMCQPKAVFDGHSVLIVGYRDEAEQPGGGVLVFRNTNHGGRDDAMPYAYAQAYMNDAVWIESKAAAPGF